MFHSGRLTTSANDLFRARVESSAIIGEEKERSHLQQCVLISDRRERGKNVVSHALHQVSLKLSLVVKTRTVYLEVRLKSHGKSTKWRGGVA